MYLWLGFPHEIVPRLSFRPNDCVVIMTHDFQKDRELLSYLTTMRLQYLGVMGAKIRTSRLFGGEPAPGWVVSPAGIPIGAQGPEEIAVSIVGDLIRHLREG
jgi:xanthine dehydrogenase accessory factor